MATPKVLRWVIRNANARKSGANLVLTGIVTGPDGTVQAEGKSKSMTLTAAQLRNTTLNLKAYNPGDANSVIEFSRPESESRRGRKPSVGQDAASITAFLASVK